MAYLFSDNYKKKVVITVLSSNCTTEQIHRDNVR